MLFYSVRKILLPCLFLVLSACTPLQRTPVSSPPSSPLQSPLVVWAAQNEVGSRAELSDPSFGDAVTVSLEREYRAASGLLCRKLRVRSGEALGEEVVVCRREGDWFLAPRIRGGLGSRRGI